MIAFGISILLICLANLGFSAVLLFHLGRIVAFIEVKDPMVTPLTQPPKLVQIKRPGNVAITTEAGKNALKNREQVVSTVHMSDSDVDRAIKDMEKSYGSN